MRDETRRAAELLMAGLIVAVLRLAWASGWFATEQGSGGVMLVTGCVFTTGVLWAMLALRTMADGGAVGQELDDGLTSMAVTAWVMAVVPPRASNFLPEGGTDDFTQVYVPMSLVVVFVVLVAQKLWRRRSTGVVVVRWAACTAVSLIFPLVATR